MHTGLGWSAKLYAEAPEPVSAVAPDGARLEIDWERGFAPVLGIWLSYGGWPPGGPPCEQVALEPTTSAHDDLASAQADGQAPRCWRPVRGWPGGCACGCHDAS